MATNNSVNEATAASGKVLQGQGVGTASAFSTATYPATATGTGTILRADGTNWAATTATYPATTTANQILYSSSASVVGEITTAANGVLITSAGSVPSISSTLPTAVQGNITSIGNLGNQLNTTRCCFSVYLASSTANNVTGDATPYTVLWDTKFFDQNTNFNTSTGTFTAPVTGIYLLVTNITAQNLGAAHIAITTSINTTAKNFITQNSITGASTTQQGFCISAIANMTAGDTAIARITVAGGTKTVGILSSTSTDPRSHFDGYLLC